MKEDVGRAARVRVVDDSRLLRQLAAAWLLLPLALLAISRSHADNFTYWLMVAQNDQLLCVWLAISVLILIPFRHGPSALRLSGAQVALVALAIGVIGYAGHYLLLSGYDLSRDEQMADFDAFIYAAGRMVWPLPPIWQATPGPLNMLFMLPGDHPVAWVSGYLPGNALLRAGFAKLGDAALTGGVLNAGSVLLVWGCARRLWPGQTLRDREAGVIAVVLLVLSGQMVMCGMTAFAMTSHLFCNLLWLWLFLRDRRRSDWAALAVGFVGTGLHQPLFHPMFVVPFLVLLLLDRRWDRLALFAGFYAAATAFWFAYPMLTHGLVTAPHTTTITAGTSYWTRLTEVLGENHYNIPIMAANLLHFVVWQHILLIPLLLAGCIAARYDRMAAALAVGFVLPIMVMTSIMPYQGHGFGYRYLHGLLGNAALLGGYGWRRLEAWHDRLRPLFVRGSLATLLVLMPVQAWDTHGVYAAYARIDAKIAKVPADYIMLGEHDVPLGLDLVLNRADLSNRPIRLFDGEIDDADALAQRICHPAGTRRRIIMALPTDAFFRDVMGWYGWLPMGRADRRLAEETTAYQDGGCQVLQLR
ncbi:MAG: hypothetical protein M3N34_09175 [Pseudomonadota bacterium]|nr:hypothetical protein [Pseudomonadota bacterium]